MRRVVRLGGEHRAGREQVVNRSAAAPARGRRTWSGRWSQTSDALPADRRRRVPLRRRRLRTEFDEDLAIDRARLRRRLLPDRRGDPRTEAEEGDDRRQTAPHPLTLL